MDTLMSSACNLHGRIAALTPPWCLLHTQAHPNKRALFVAAEITTAACYTGKELARMLANTLFRVGGAAALLTNKLYARNTANYVMMATTRVHSASDSKAYE